MMLEDATYVSLLYENNRKITERILPDKDFFKRLSLREKEATFELVDGQMIITLENVIFIKISTMISLLDVGDILPTKRTYDNIEGKIIDLELFFDNGSIENIKNLKYIEDIATKLKPKMNANIHLSNLDKEDFYFNMKNVVYIKIINTDSHFDISKSLI